MDTQIYIYRDDCTTQLASDDDDGPGLYSYIAGSECTPPVDGDYYVKVESVLKRHRLLQDLVLLRTERKRRLLFIGRRLHSDGAGILQLLRASSRAPGRSAVRTRALSPPPAATRRPAPAR